MSEFGWPDNEPIPYWPNQYSENIRMIGDVAMVILDNHGCESIGAKERAIDIAKWEDSELMTKYELVRIHDPAEVDPRVTDQLELDVIETYPNGKTSHKRYIIRPTMGVHSAYWIRMTDEQQRKYEERLAVAKTMPSGIKVLPPEKDGLSPEHESELILGVTGKGLEILSDDD